jgi:hypothetical protein
MVLHSSANNIYTSIHLPLHIATNVPPQRKEKKEEKNAARNNNDKQFHDNASTMPQQCLVNDKSMLLAQYSPFSHFVGMLWRPSQSQQQKHRHSERASE